MQVNLRFSTIISQTNLKQLSPSLPVLLLNYKLAQILAVSLDDLLVPVEGILSVSRKILHVKLISVDIYKSVSLGDSFVS